MIHLRETETDHLRESEADQSLLRIRLNRFRITPYEKCSNITDLTK